MPDINPISVSWDHPIPQRTPELDPSQGDLDIESYTEELHPPQPFDENQKAMMDRFGLINHLNFNLPDAALQACSFNGHVESPDVVFGPTSPDIPEDERWTSYSSTFPDADHHLSTSAHSHLTKFTTGPDYSNLIDDISSLPPDQLHPLEDTFPTEYSDRFPPGYQTDSVLQDLRRSWSPSFVADHSFLPETYSSTVENDDSSSNGEGRALDTYSAAYFSLADLEFPIRGEYSDPDQVISPISNFPSRPSPSEQFNQDENQYNYLAKSDFSPDSSHKTNMLLPDRAVNAVLEEASQGDSCSSHTDPHSHFSEGDSPILIQTAETSPVRDLGDYIASGSSASPDRSVDFKADFPSAELHDKETPNKRASGARKRKSRHVSDVEKPAKAMAIQIVQEDGLGGSIAPSACIPAVARARRNGPLSLDGRRDAALRRKDKTVCVWCRLAKKKCSGESPCTTCIEQAKTIVFEQPCVKADFFQIVESGTCNYISQRAINHPTLDGSTRVRMELPATFEMKELLDLLDKRRGRFNIRARQSWGTLYVLDLDETYNFLKDLNKAENSSRYDLRDFIDRKILKFNKWTSCVKDCDPISNLFSLLSQWNNMPSRASYDFVSASPSHTSRPMDVHNPDDQTDIILAAQLSRIFCRKLEVDGYRALQNSLNKNKWDTVPYDTFINFVSQLGQILLTLRWRVSWWELLGDGGKTPDLDKERYEERVRRLCQILYFYYTSVKLKLPSWNAPTTQLDGVWSTYADAMRVWDDFPSDASLKGFDAWMARGKELIQEAGVQSRISKFAEKS
ncbi:hypothetical protein FQN53_003112 [Emmonsiellopsis sp. PD_33]|nr:hypothetical protein FQN53_003112 [Emmonsiellopsis sp. PD_33]KAK2806378.1 hypothetical protein FQN51_007422 [Onygenales sp. PD_10]